MSEEIGFTGHVYDVDTGLTDMQARMYDPLIGRFLSTDPVSFNASSPFTFNRYAYANNNLYRFTDPTGMATSCDENNCTITADNGPKEGRTITASVDVKVAANVGKDAAATKSGSTEKIAAVEKTADGKLTVATVKGSGDGSSSTGTTASVKLPGDTVAGMHGHIDSGPDRSNGMVDSPRDNGGLGDASSLKVGVPMATVSQGQVGWHEMENGTLKFSAPAGAMSSSQMSAIQQNLNVEQKQFP